MRESASDRISVGGGLYLEHSICQKEHKSQNTHRLDQVLDPLQPSLPPKIQGSPLPDAPRIVALETSC